MRLFRALRCTHDRRSWLRIRHKQTIDVVSVLALIRTWLNRFHKAVLFELVQRTLDVPARAANSNTDLPDAGVTGSRSIAQEPQILPHGVLDGT